MPLRLRALAVLIVPTLERSQLSITLVLETWTPSSGLHRHITDTNKIYERKREEEG